MNLAGNALKFTSEGSVTIKARKKSKTIVTFSVIDTGIGIKEEEIATLFSRYEKLDLGDKSHLNPTGAGLGLSISYDIATYLGPTDNFGI